MLVVKLTVLCELSLVMTFYLKFQVFVKMCLSYRMILLTEAQDSLMCSLIACYQQMILYYTTQCYCIEP